MKIFATFVSLLITGTLSLTGAQDPLPSTDELIKNVPQLENIPGLANFNTSSIKTEDVKKLIVEKCEKNGGPTAFDAAKDSPMIASNCFQSLLNWTQLESEMVAARPNGELDVVFKKYCRRIPSFKKCLRNVTDTVEPCLEAEERENINTIHNIASSIFKFICDNEGDRIAMFIAAGGRECFNESSPRIQKCANETLSSYLPKPNAEQSGIPALTSIPSLVMGLRECMDIEKFRTCSVTVLEECKDPTPANVVDSLLIFVRKNSPCNNLLNIEKSSSISTVNILSITVAMFLSLQFA